MSQVMIDLMDLLENTQGSDCPHHGNAVANVMEILDGLRVYTQLLFEVEAGVGRAYLNEDQEGLREMVRRYGETKRMLNAWEFFGRVPQAWHDFKHELCEGSAPLSETSKDISDFYAGFVSAWKVKHNVRDIVD